MATEAEPPPADEAPAKPAAAPFPYVAMFFLSLGMLAHSVVFTAPLPYVAYMIVDFHMAPDVDTAGYTAGWITGMFMVGRTFAGVPWGMAADRYGRRICLALSMFNIALFGLAFGFSTSFLMAVSMRLCIGLGNGFMGIAKTSVTEITSSKEHEIQAFGYLNGVWGLGMIVGPAIGGFLARPAVLYPHLFAADGFWAHYPYLLPCIVSSAIAVLAGVGTLCFVPETLTLTAYTAVSGNDDKEIEMAPLGEDAADIESASALVVEESSSSSSSGHKLPGTFMEILRNRQIQVLFVIYLMTCFIVLLTDEAFPLWALTHVRNGGLGWESTQVGEMLATIGLGLIVFQLVFYKPMLTTCCSADKPVSTYARCVAIMSIFLATLPFLTDAIMRSLEHAHHPWAAYSDNGIDTRSNVYLRVGMTVCWLAYRIPATAGFTTLAIIVNASVDKKMRGTMNGLIMTAGSLGNSAGPIIGSALYAAALHHAYPDANDLQHHRTLLPLDGRVVFLLAGTMALCLAVFARLAMSVQHLQS